MEPDETFSAELYDRTPGAVLGLAYTASILILDDDRQPHR
jgi:hypothetical protein